MSLWRHLTRGLRVLGNRRAADQEIADEVSHYLDEAAAALVAKGRSPDAARRAARLELGNATGIREQVRGYGWENRMETLFADLRFAVRRLGANPGFTAVSVLTLALGIGASTAIFSVINGVLLKPLPYSRSEQLVALLHTAPGIKIEKLALAASLYFTYSEENRVFSGRRHLDGQRVDGNGSGRAGHSAGPVGVASISRRAGCSAGARARIQHLGRRPE
jgi:hypothetical protein